MKGRDRLWPVCTSWPMGFSWSSFVAQSKLLRCCEDAGLARDHMLAEDLPIPNVTDTSIALATDDVMLFTIGDPHEAKPWLDRLDQSIECAGVIAHHGKDINAKLSGTAIGIDLVDGKHFAAHGPKLIKVIEGTLHFIRVGFASPIEVSAGLGHMSWFALLSRPTFACFVTIYSYGAQVAEGARSTLAPGVLARASSLQATLLVLSCRGAHGQSFSCSSGLR